MKRMHVHVSVSSLDEAITFYSALFSAKPTVVKDDYAKWMLDDPRVNFAVSTRGNAPGLNHLGIQVQDREELDEVYGCLRQAGRTVLDVGATTCCQSENAWTDDPAGIPWETFLTTGESTSYGRSKSESGEPRVARGCCASPPTSETRSACCSV